MTNEISHYYMVMQSRIDPTIYANDIEYFFTLLGPRFEPVIQLMSESLSQRFHKHYEPIRVFSAVPNRYFAGRNYIVLNERARKITKRIGDEVIYLQEYEELNLEFTNSPYVREIANKLLEKQQNIYIYSFTTSFLDPADARWIVLGPSSDIAKEFDNKVRQFELFQELNLPTNEARVFSSSAELKNTALSDLPFYISAAYTSGGNESGLVFSEEMLDGFLSRLREINTKDRFLAANIFENLVVAPNATAIITERGASVLTVSDQILRGTRYLGNVYPSAISQALEENILEIMTRIGSYLGGRGYRGLFGCDFLINRDGKLVVVDLNPRRQGGYSCVALALLSSGVNLTNLELSCALGDVTDELPDYQAIQYEAAWAHSKVKPYDPGQRIRQELKHGELSDIFRDKRGDFSAGFYQKDAIFIDGYIGYVAKTGTNRKEVLQEVLDEPNHLLGMLLG